MLKVDCEECEYELFKTASDGTLSKFNKFKQIVIKYHYGFKALVKRLKEANFNVKRSITGILGLWHNTTLHFSGRR